MLKNQGESNLTQVEAQIAKEAKERQRQYHGNQYQSAVGSNLTQVQNEEKETGRTAEIMAKVEEQIAKEAEQKHVEAMAKARESRWNKQSTSNLTETDEPKKRNDTTAGQMAKKQMTEHNRL